MKNTIAFQCLLIAGILFPLGITAGPISVQTQQPGITHPLKLEPLSVTPSAKATCRKVQYAYKIPEDLAEQNISEYGEQLGGYFSKKRQVIDKRIVADIDGDKIPEEILITSDVYVNHPPHHGYILKNGILVLHIPLQSGDIDPSEDGHGFYARNMIRDDGAPYCCPNGYRRYKVILENGQFKPVWEQEIIFKNIPAEKPAHEKFR